MRFSKHDLVRVGSLRRLGLLDTAPEERFDRITRLARRLFDVDAAWVNLVDIDRQWAKSRQGRLAVVIDQELPFCNYTILDQDVLEVSDAPNDPRFAGDPWVTGEPRVRFYAGCPVASPEGAMIGTLCLLDHRPRSLEADDLAALRDLGAMVEHEIAVTRLAVDDTLTGLVNLRGFTLVGTQAMAFCRRQRVDALVVVARVEGLDIARDRGGQAAADQLLRLAATVMTDTFRSSDVVARVHRDRFAALLTGFDGSEGQIAGRLRAAVAASNLELQRTTFGLAMTMGSARFSHRDPESLDVLMHRADPANSADDGRRRSAAPFGGP